MKPEKKSHKDFFPQDRKSIKTLNSRAEQLSRPEQNFEKSKFCEDVIQFRLGKVEKYAIPYNNIIEVRNFEKICSVPHTPPFIFGVINLRGNILTIVNLKYFFNIPEESTHGEKKIIVIGNSTLTIGIVADEIQGAEEYDMAELSPPINQRKSDRYNFSKGVYSCSSTVIDTDAILQSKDILVNYSPKET